MPSGEPIAGGDGARCRALDHDGEIERLRSVLRDYEHRITWDTTCKQCADTLDLAVSQTFRAEEAEEKVAKVVDILDRHGHWYSGPLLYRTLCEALGIEPK